MIQIKRAYETASKKDERRILIDRLWPRGITKQALRLSAWFKELAPSTELRKSFGHDPKHWKSFQTKYKKELKSSAARAKLSELVQFAKKATVTLLYGAKDESHNNAVVLKELIEKELKK